MESLIDEDTMIRTKKATYGGVIQVIVANKPTPANKPTSDMGVNTDIYSNLKRYQYQFLDSKYFSGSYV